MNAKPIAAWLTEPPKKADELPAMNNYLMTQAGVVNYRQLPYGISIEPLEGDPIIKGPEFQIPKSPDLKLHLSVPRIPWSVYAQVVSFFRAVNDKHNAEAIIRIFYDRKKNAWYPHCPEQEVTGAHVSHKDDFDAAGKLMHVIDIHSHNTMSAFFSGTDDSDEKKAVRLYGVVGLINQPIPASSWRAWTGKKFIDLQLLDVIAPPPALSIPVNFDVPDLLKEKGGIKELVLTGKEFTSQLFSGFPEEWMKQVSKPTYYSTGASANQGSFYGEGWEGDWDHGRVAGFGGASGPRGFRGRDHISLGGHTVTDRRHHAGRKGKSTNGAANGADEQGSDPAPLTSLVDLEGDEADIIPMVALTAKDTSKCVYLVDRKSQAIFRVFPDGRCQRREFGLGELWTIKQQKQTTTVEVYAVPEFTKSEEFKGEGN